MEKLVDLRTYREGLTKQIASANWGDCTLPQAFKSAFTQFGLYRVDEYYAYSAKVSSSKSICIVPNQWFYVAACCSQYHTELMNYKTKLVSLGITDDQFEACHPSSDSRISDDQKTPAALKAKAESFLASYSGEDKELLVSFLWDYESWGGGKNIKRQNDFTESPVLNIANFINASSGLVGAIAKALSDNSKARVALFESKEWQDIFSGQTKAPKGAILGPVRGGYLNEGKRGFWWQVLKYFHKEDGLKEMFDGGLFRNPENKYAYIGPTPVAHIESSTIGISAETMTIFNGTILSNTSDVMEFYNGIEAFNKFYAGRYEIVVTKNGQGDEVYYLNKIQSTTPVTYDKYLRALRTKPFMLLAGISGTGKSRIVRELAFKSCPEYLQDKDKTTLGNYCMIEVKPNWHDSSEIIGYYSNINKQYQFSRFVKFLVKAMMFPKVPFFVCLDEMNLAPVEQYFAEFLSILETRKKSGDHIQTGVLVEGRYFHEIGVTGCKNNGEVYMKLHETNLDYVDADCATATSLIENGLTLPDNVFVIGTVNMDDTTHQFSRKVIDRAMTIEMNGGKLSEMFGHSADLEYLPAEQVWKLDIFQPKHVNADEVVANNPDATQIITEELPKQLDAINDVLRDTPFQVSYRVLNEMVIYFSVLVESGMPSEEAKNLAVDQMLLMKILPRIEGDRDMLMLDAQTCRLDKLEPFAASEDSKKKIAEMKNRLSKQEFTRFWP